MGDMLSLPSSAEHQPFDRKYKIIIKYYYGPRFNQQYDEEMVNWIQTNSNGSVDLKISDKSQHYYIGFEDPDDALFFKIKYSV